jgi:preprotein translocase subunit SecD
MRAPRRSTRACRTPAKLLVVVWAIMLGTTATSNESVANASCPEVGFTVVEPHATSETRAVRVGRHQTIFVRREAITRTSDISGINLAGDDDDALILIKFTQAADQRLHDATTNHSGMRIAFLFDNEVLLNVVWEGPYGMDTGGTQVSIRHGMNQARRLMKAIRGCTATTTGDR